MENYSYPDSRESSPRSREIDCETASWADDQPPSATSTYKVKFMCSYGGKIQPRPHDHQLAYVGGDTKILAVDRNIKLSAFASKLASLCDTPNDVVCFKYQLPGEDLDALISVTNDEDLEHMMIEYDRLYRASAKPARLRLFLFPLGNNPSASFGSNESKSERQWFVDALNSVQIGSPDGSSPTAPVTASPANPDFLFGFDKGYSAVPVQKFPETVTPPTVPDSLVKSPLVGSEDRQVVGEQVMSQVEIQRQIQELQRMQIAAGHEPTTIYHRKSDEIGNPRAYTPDYYSQKLPENLAPVQGSSPVAMPTPVQMPTAYMPERHMNTGGYPVAAGQSGPEQPVYLISTPTGVYQAPAHRPATGPVGQAYYGVPQRMVPEVYRDAQAYNTAVAAQQAQQQVQHAQQAQQAQQAKVGAYSEGFAQVGYEAVGRQVYYTTAGGVVSSYQTVAPVAVDGRQGGVGALNQIQDGKVVVSMASQASAM
ncbi:hypothetical protein PRUPE_1G540000 [Prunus persica]|uniref:PB1 domain-containing protein n=1 Tax=Prunus persica TaxID=3760 RepID=A0A251RHQ0_PRUPE|nr:hypothetical protein PRUPE_1G540000 [Prunus persica]